MTKLPTKLSIINIHYSLQIYLQLQPIVFIVGVHSFPVIISNISLIAETYIYI